MDIAQIGIVVFGCAAIWFIGRREAWRRWGFILGLCSQPFWFWTAYEHRQWGVGVLAVFYTYAWAQGVWNYWIRKGGE